MEKKKGIKALRGICIVIIILGAISGLNQAYYYSFV